MNKKELADRVAERTGLPKYKARQAVDALLDAAGEALAAGENVQLTGFGKLEPVKRAGRRYRRPATGETGESGARNGVRFTAGTGLQKLLNGEGE